MWSLVPWDKLVSKERKVFKAFRYGVLVRSNDCQGPQGVQGTQGLQGPQGTPGGAAFTYIGSSAATTTLNFGDSVAVAMDTLYNSVNSNLTIGSILIMTDGSAQKGGYVTVTNVSYSAPTYTVTLQNNYPWQAAVVVSASRQCLVVGPIGPQGQQGKDQRS